MKQRLSQLGTYFDQEASEGRLGVRSNAILLRRGIHGRCIAMFFRRDIHVGSITIFCRRDTHGHKVPSNFRRKFLKSFRGWGGGGEWERVGDTWKVKDISYEPQICATYFFFPSQLLIALLFHETYISFWLIFHKVLTQNMEVEVLSITQSN